MARDRSMLGVRSKSDRAFNIDPPASSYSIMRGGTPPTAERTVGPARIIVESLTPRPGTREQYRHEADLLRSQSFSTLTRTAAPYSRRSLVQSRTEQQPDDSLDEFFDPRSDCPIGAAADHAFCCGASSQMARSRHRPLTRPLSVKQTRFARREPFRFRPNSDIDDQFCCGARLQVGPLWPPLA